MLDVAVAVGAVPERFGEPFDLADSGQDALARYFAMARGADGVPALELTKWFDTNYHYLVPELLPDQAFRYVSKTTAAQFREALALGIATRPVVIGPLSFLRLAKRTDGGRTIELLDAVLPAYADWLADLAGTGATEIQLDEPALVLDLSPAEADGYRRAYARLRDAVPGVQLCVATYFGGLGDNLELAVGLPIDALHVDLVRDPSQLDAVLAAAPASLRLSLGVVDGRNVWRTDLTAAYQRLLPVVSGPDSERLQLAPSCSLLHLPVDLASETGGDAELESWLAFATQRLDEVTLLAAALNGDADAIAGLAESTTVLDARRTSPRVRRPAVQERLAAVTPEWSRRGAPYAERALAQHDRLGCRCCLPRPSAPFRRPPRCVGCAPPIAAATSTRTPTGPAWRSSRWRVSASRRSSASTSWCTASSSAPTWSSTSA